MSSFFRNVDSRYDDPVDIPFKNGTNEIKCLKARAILVDMEQGPVSETLNGPLGELFDNRQFITDVSGSGNNWYVHDSSITSLITAQGTWTCCLWSEI